MSIESAKTEQKKNGGAKRLSAIEMDEIWKEVQARHRNGLGWIPPQSGANRENFHSPVVAPRLDSFCRRTELQSATADGLATTGPAAG